jgi:trk system potassium uptake protein TrkH
MKYPVKRLRFLVLFRVLILLLGITALTMIPSLIMALGEGEETVIRAFLFPMVPALLLALIAFTTFRGVKISFNAADGFLLVFLAWVLICLMGTLPLYGSGYVGRFSDAIFESVSGFTTTGATVIADVEALPRSLLFWRGMTHWLGGMGIVGLTVALFPLLGGGFQLVRAETPGPEKGRITPTMTATVKTLWLLYAALTAAQALLLRLAGMDWFDALVHAFSTMGTGGFSTRNQGLAHYQSPWIGWICIVFMFLAGLNFSLYYRLLQGKYRDILNNSEAKAYAFITLCSTALIAFSLFTGAETEKRAPEPVLRQAFFHSASILSSTGFSIADHRFWPPLAQAALFLLMFIGGCSGSTAGGVKVIRHVVLWKQAGNEMKRLIYPKGVFNIRLNNRIGRKDVVYGVAGFVALYMLLVLAAALLVSSAGTDLFSSLNAGLLTLGNIGSGLGKFGPGSVFYDLPAYVKWGLSFIMIVGRLELWVVFVLFPHYWRR